MAKTKRAQQTGSKSTFIRQHPDLSVDELVAKAEEEGMSIAPNLVYKVRGRAKTGSVSAAPTRRGRPPRAAAAREPGTVAAKKEPAPARANDNETTFRKLVLELGLQRAKALLVEVEDRLQALVAGR